MKEKICKIFSSNIRVHVSGRNAENFIKRLIKNKINIVKVLPISYREVDIIISYDDLEKIEKIKSIYDIKVVKYYGMLNMLKQLKKNIYILSFLIIGIILIYILSNMIFSIDVIHSNSKIIKLIEDELYNHGIRKYSFVKDYEEIEKIEEEILNDNKENLEWLEITRNGTKYIVRVEERIINNEPLDNKRYDIVANKNAVLTSVIAEKGEKRKNINTYVKKGEVIISSNITMPNNEIIPSSAKGKVTGEVWYTASIEYPYYYNEVSYTGKKRKILVYNFLSKRISFFDFNEFKSFNKDTKYIYKNSFMPISLAIEYQYETNVVNNIYTYDEARSLAIEVAKKRLLDKYQNIINITNIKVTSEEDLTSKIRLTLFITCEEDITKYVEVKEEDNSAPQSPES